MIKYMTKYQHVRWCKHSGNISWHDAHCCIREQYFYKFPDLGHIYFNCTNQQFCPFFFSSDMPHVELVLLTHPETRYHPCFLLGFMLCSLLVSQVYCRLVSLIFLFFFAFCVVGLFSKEFDKASTDEAPDWLNVSW